MTGRFDEVVHAPNRLRICALLAASSSAEFAVLRDILGVADSVVSKHLKVLQDAGYVAISKPTGQGPGEDLGEPHRRGPARLCRACPGAQGTSR